MYLEPGFCGWMEHCRKLILNRDHVCSKIKQFAVDQNGGNIDEIVACLKTRTEVLT